MSVCIEIPRAACLLRWYYGGRLFFARYPDDMNALEVRTVASLAAVFALRMLGLFMLLPVLAVYADQVSDASPALVGLALGAYGLSQACMQIPAGLLSDRVGRKPVIVGGLLMFVAGSLLAAFSDSMAGLVVGRFLQGSGAIAAAITALLADLVRAEYRTRAMAVMGVTIGFSFCLAMILGPVLAASAGLSGMFLVIAAFALAAIAVVIWIVPAPERVQADGETGSAAARLRRILTDNRLMRLNAGVFALHFVLVALFVHLPVALERAGQPRAEHGWVYLVAMLVSFVAAMPLIMMAERTSRSRQVLVGAVALLWIAQLVVALEPGITGLMAGIVLFFLAFNYLEASLPTLVSKIAPTGSRGAAMGVFSTSQFLGAGLGGGLAGLVYQWCGDAGLLVLVSLVTVLWAWLAVVDLKGACSPLGSQAPAPVVCRRGVDQ
ncbi:MAG: MFS transporter [Kistimonas sp.]|nr:MFS transporter [Kistimonas sp.]